VCTTLVNPPWFSGAPYDSLSREKYMELRDNEELVSKATVVAATSRAAAYSRPGHTFTGSTVVSC